MNKIIASFFLIYIHNCLSNNNTEKPTTPSTSTSVRSATFPQVTNDYKYEHRPGHIKVLSSVSQQEIIQFGLTKDYVKLEYKIDKIHTRPQIGYFNNNDFIDQNSNLQNKFILIDHIRQDFDTSKDLYIMEGHILMSNSPFTDQILDSFALNENELFDTIMNKPNYFNVEKRPVIKNDKVKSRMHEYQVSNFLVFNKARINRDKKEKELNINKSDTTYIGSVTSHYFLPVNIKAKDGSIITIILSPVSESDY